MNSYRIAFSERQLNHFVDLLTESVPGVDTLRFDLMDDSFRLHLEGKRYVNYAINARFYVLEVNYSVNTQIIKFRQIGKTRLRGRFLMGGFLKYLVDDPLRDFITNLSFATHRNSIYTFNLRNSDTMRSFFDTKLTGYRLTELFPIDRVNINDGDLEFVGG